MGTDSRTRELLLHLVYELGGLAQGQVAHEGSVYDGPTTYFFAGRVAMLATVHRKE